MTPTKPCSRCGKEKPATLEFFRKRSDSKDGLRGYCRDCHDLYAKEWDKRHPERVRQNARTKTARYRSRNREMVRERTREWKQNNPEKIRAYRNRHRRRFVVYKENREARRRNLPNTLTSEEWENALSFFDYQCAVCERPLNGLFHTAAADHWIPLSDPDCPGTTVLNIIPLCHGQDGCNNSKSNKHPDQWLVERLGKRRAKVILDRIHGYFVHLQSNRAKSRH